MAKNTPDLRSLSPEMTTFCRGITRRYALAEHHKKLLRCAAEAHDRMTQARGLLATQGLTFTNRHGELKPHPALAVELASRTSFARCLRELGLGDDATDDTMRPPRLQGRYQGRK